MLLDFGWSELMLIGVVALVVIGPKDLPRVLRQLTQWIKKARELAADFQRNVDEMMREAELADLKNQIEKATSGVVEDVQKSIDPGGEIKKALEAPPAFDQPPASVAPTPTPPPAFPADPAAAETVPLAQPTVPVEMGPPTPVEPMRTPAPVPSPATAANEAQPAPAAEPPQPAKAAS